MKYLIIFLSFAGIVGIYYFWITSLRCNDFDVQPDAQFFYYIGAHQLDGYDQDGKACESLRSPR